MTESGLISGASSFGRLLLVSGEHIGRVEVGNRIRTKGGSRNCKRLRRSVCPGHL